MQKAKNGSSKQGKLDKTFLKVDNLKEFAREGLLKAVAKFVVCDDQVGEDSFDLRVGSLVAKSLAVVDKAAFRNCLVAMRPRSTNADLPSTHNVKTYIHNEFVQMLNEFKNQISVGS